MNKMPVLKLSATQKMALKWWATGQDHGLQSNHKINADRALERLGFLKRQYAGNSVQTSITQEGIEFAKCI